MKGEGTFLWLDCSGGGFEAHTNPRGIDGDGTQVGLYYSKDGASLGLTT